MNIDKTIERLEQMKKDAKTALVASNLQIKIDLLKKKQRQIDNEKI